MDELWKVLIPAIALVLGTLIGGLLTIITTIIINSNNRKLEKIKVHDNPKFQALIRLVLFASHIRNRSFPLAENKIPDFMSIMNEYSDEMLSNSLYFNKETQEILDEFDENYGCLNAPELVSETIDDVHEFIETELFAKSERLRDLAKTQAKELLK